MSLHFLSENNPTSTAMKVGLRAPRRTRDEYAGLDRLDRPELDEDDLAPTAETPGAKQVA
jgi:hypothetical protein